MYLQVGLLDKMIAKIKKICYITKRNTETKDTINDNN